MFFDRYEYNRAVRRRLADNSISWGILVALASGCLPWLVRSYHRGDVGMPELIDVVIGVSVFGLMEGGRYFKSRIDAGYAVYIEELNRENARQEQLHSELRGRDATIVGLREQVADLQQRLNRRRDDQAIADALRDLNTEAIHDILNLAPEPIASATNLDELAHLWMPLAQAWDAKVIATMETIGCEPDEVHYVRDFVLPPLYTHDFNPQMNSQWTITYVRRERLEEIMRRYQQRADSPQKSPHSD
jgi:uncharacterized protein (DUF433 family)